MTKIEEIYAVILPEMNDLKIEDNPENRISFLRGLRDEWKDDRDVSIKKAFYIGAVNREIRRLQSMIAPD